MSQPAAETGYTEKLIVEKRAGVGWIGLNQPEKLNAVAYEMWVDMAKALDDFAADDSVRAVVVYGEGGKAFSAGADISQFEKNRSSEEQVAIYNAATGAAHAKLAGMPKPTIAKIRGYCIGGGLAVAMDCDLRIATEGSKFAIPAAKLGLGYSHDNLKVLVDLVGPSNAKEILFTANRFTAVEAQGMGLVNRALPDDELDAFVERYTETIAGNAPLTVKACKTIVGELMKEASDRDVELCKAVVADCFASEDYKEGRRAFMEKRKPEFKGV